LISVRTGVQTVDEATRAPIFDPFFSTKFSGRALGLAAVEGIVLGHKGASLVRNSPAKGSRFTVLFPASMSAGQLVQKAPRPARQVSGVVLVVDDAELARDMARSRSNGMSITFWWPTAVRRPSISLSGAPPLVVLDLSMPHMSGEEVLPELRKIRPQAKVIISSG